MKIYTSYNQFMQECFPKDYEAKKRERMTPEELGRHLAEKSLASIVLKIK